MEYAAHMPMMEEYATPKNLISFAKRMEALGFHALFASDHVVIPYKMKPVYKGSADGQFPFPKQGKIVETIVALCAVGMVTERIKLGTAVMVLPHRNPILVAKQLASVDYLTGGRVILGAGAGWMEEEITLLGQPFKERGAWCTEAIDIMRALWAEEKPCFKGKFFDMPQVGMQPKPIKGRIPILIGGTSAPALRRVINQGDGWLPSNSTFEMLADGITTLKNGCEKAGRNYEELSICLRARMAFEPQETKYKVMFIGSDEQIVDNLSRLKEMGISMVMFEPIYKEYNQWVEAHDRLAENILPRV